MREQNGLLGGIVWSTPCRVVLSTVGSRWFRFSAIPVRASLGVVWSGAISAALGSFDMSPDMSVLLASETLARLAGPVVVFAGKNLRSEYDLVENRLIYIFVVVKLHHHGGGPFLSQVTLQPSRVDDLDMFQGRVVPLNFLFDFHLVVCFHLRAHAMDQNSVCWGFNFCFSSQGPLPLVPMSDQLFRARRVCSEEGQVSTGVSFHSDKLGLLQFGVLMVPEGGVDFLLDFFDGGSSCGCLSVRLVQFDEDLPGSDRGALLGSGLQYVRVFHDLRIGRGGGFTDGGSENVLDSGDVLSEGF
ncbi:hypothetical protein BJX65DRAFT_289744 [Aspergillus insuetus]